MDKVRLRDDRRWYERLFHGPDYDIWVISWLPGQTTGFHGHAYSPSLKEMNGYELGGGRLVPLEHPSWRAETHDLNLSGEQWNPEPQVGALGIEQALLAARARLRRLSPSEVSKAVVEAGAVLVDIRPESQRATEGSIRDALIVERNVLEWRFDSASSARLPIAKDHDLQVIVFCSEGYTSSLAAAALQGLGLSRATDMAGAFQAWRTAGLPIVPPARTSKARSF